MRKTELIYFTGVLHFSSKPALHSHLHAHKCTVNVVYKMQTRMAQGSLVTKYGH